MSKWIQVEELGLTFELCSYFLLSSEVKNLEEPKELLRHWSYEYSSYKNTEVFYQKLFSLQLVSLCYPLSQF